MVAIRTGILEGACSHVRFGSKADMCSAKCHVRFTPDNDRESAIRLAPATLAV